jgi:hypothetical protein
VGSVGIAGTLEELGGLLGRYGYARHAEDVARLRTHYVDDRDRFVQELNELPLWGGAGSLADAASLAGDHVDEQQATIDQRRFRELVIELVQALDEEGLANDDAALVANAFRRLNEMEST